MVKKYRVRGVFEGKRINIVVDANSGSQAKQVAAFKTKNFGPKLGPFRKKVRPIEIR